MDKEKELVSIIVPIYKVEAYLDRCVCSIVNQTYEKIEVILVDDGSPDECPHMCDKWALHDSRIKVIHKANEGVAKARNIGIAASSGKFLMFVDSDDYLHETTVEVLYNRLKKDNSDLAVGQAVHVYEDGRTDIVEKEKMCDAIYLSDEVLRMFGSSKYIPCYSWAKLYKTELFLGLNYSELICGEDQHIWLELISRCEKISTVSDKVYYYYQRMSSVVHTRSDRRFLDALSAELHCARFFLERNMLEQARYFFALSIFQALEVHNRIEAIQIYRQSFTLKEQMFLLRRDSRSIFRWLSIYCPLLCDAVQRLKK